MQRRSKKMDNKEVFHYHYSAKEQDEIKAIRKKYAAPEECEDKMSQLRQLDGAVTQKATTVSLVFGIIGTLILGIGMSLAMTQIGSILGASQEMAMLIGIIVGLAGIVLLSLAYPLYNRILKKERKKIAPQIIKLTDELMK